MPLPCRDLVEADTSRVIDLTAPAGVANHDVAAVATVIADVFTLILCFVGVVALGPCCQ
jgi:hypothetical protein